MITIINRQLKQTAIISSFLLALLLLASCKKDDSPALGEKHAVVITTRAAEEGAPEAAYPHALLLFNEAGKGTNAAAIEALQATTAATLQPLSLANGNYTAAALAYSTTANLTFTPAIAKGNTLNAYLSVSTGATPDILFATKPFTVSGASSTSLTLQRIVGRAVVTLSNVPASPAVKTMELVVGKLTDRFALDGTHTASVAAGVERTIALTPTAGAYTNGTDGTILMPTVEGLTSMPLTLRITYTDNTTATQPFTISGATLRAGYTTTLALNYVPGRTAQSIAATYTPWQVGTTHTADVEMDDTTPTGTGTIGTLTQGGIVCTPNLVIALTEAPTLLAWSIAPTRAATGSTSTTDGATNYTAFAAWAAGGASRWTNQPAYDYLKTLREATSAEWYLPSRDEWAAIAANLPTLNTALTANGATTINGAAYYWASTENGADYAFRILPNTKTTLSIGKDQTYRVRAVKQITQ